MSSRLRALGRLTGTVLSAALLATVVASALALVVVPRLNHARPLTVLTGSMTPTYPPGDVVVVRPTNPRTLHVGQVITFQAVSDVASVTTHRIVAIEYGAHGRRYVTRGDANGANDPKPIAPDQVRGEVWYSVPKVGYLATWASRGTLHTAINLFALGLLLYGIGLFGRGLLERRRHRS